MKCPLYSGSGNNDGSNGNNSNGGGCKWIGSYNDIITHLSTNCLYHMTTCSQCSISLLRYQLPEHTTMECVNRMVKCHLCYQSMIHSLLINHINTICHMASVTCDIIHQNNIQQPVYTSYPSSNNDISPNGSSNGINNNNGSSDTKLSISNTSTSSSSSVSSNGSALLPIIKPINVHGSGSVSVKLKGCGGTYLRRDINHHQQYDCVKTLITCTRYLLSLHVRPILTLHSTYNDHVL